VLPLGGQVAPTAPTGIVSSPDALPPKYSVEQLRNYIMRKLGYPVWNVELTPAQIDDCINDAVSRYSQWCPLVRYRALRLTKEVTEYLRGEDNGMGVVKVDFVCPILPIAAIYGNLIDVTPLPAWHDSCIADFDTFLRWQKTWKRVTSTEPDWLWDQDANVLRIHNPITNYHAGAVLYYPYTDTLKLPFTGANWVKEYALAQAQLTLGTIFAKFSGAIPTPVASLTLDQSKRGSAEAKIKELEERLFGMQTAAAISQD